MLEIDFISDNPAVARGELLFGYVFEGQVRAGDGLLVGSLDVGARAILFDRDRVDPSSLGSEAAVSIQNPSTTVVVLVWRDETGEIAHAGMEVSYTNKAGFQVGQVMESTQLIEYLNSVDFSIEDSAERLGIPDSARTPFTELSVSGYRGFAGERTLLLAQPNGTQGSGLTVLVGANNSGKSTFIEALHAIARARQQTDLSFPQPRRHRDLDSVTIQLTRADGRRLRVESTEPGSSQATAKWLPDSDVPTLFDLQVTPSRRQFSPYFGNVGSEDRNWGLLNQEFSRTDLREQFVGRLRKVNRTPTARAAFDDLLAEVIGSRLKWTIDEIAPNQQFLKMIEADGAWHTSEGLGDGLVSLLFIVDALYDSDPGSLIAIDEPELSLHPQLIRRLGRILARYAANRQILIATHSPLVLDWADVGNGATVARVFKVEGKSEVAQPSPEILTAVARLAGDRNLRNPHTVGSVAREAFFLEDGVILTEGQDDVAYLPRILDDLGLRAVDNVYGWGSGGVGNIPTLARLFLELGFTKIAAIVDDDEQPGTVAALDKLRGMGSKVLAVQIPAPDIRHKDAAPAKPEVNGLLDADNAHVRPELRAQATAVFSSVIDHVSLEDSGTILSG